MHRYFPDLLLPSGCGWQNKVQDIIDFIQLFYSGKLWITYRTMVIYSACKVRLCRSFRNLIHFQRYSKSSFYDPVRRLCLFFPHQRTRFVFPNVSHKSQFMHQLQVFSEVSLDTPPLYCRSNWNSALFFLPLTLFDWSPPPSLTHLMKIDLFCLDFHSAFRLRGFSLQCQLYIFSKCVPVIKEKATQPGPRQQAKVDTNVIETGYWYSPCWTPAHLGGEPFLLYTLSLEVFLS